MAEGPESEYNRDINEQDVRFFQNLDRLEQERPDMSEEDRYQIAWGMMMADHYLGDESFGDIYTAVESGLPLTDGQWSRLSPIINEPESQISLGRMMLLHALPGSEHEYKGLECLILGSQSRAEDPTNDPESVLKEIVDELDSLHWELSQTPGKQELAAEVETLLKGYVHKQDAIDQIKSRFPVASSVPRPPGL